MRSISYPPFIVFFDTIAVILFVLILNQTAGAEFVLPKSNGSKEIFRNAELVYKRVDKLYYENGSVFQAEKYDSIYLAPCDAYFACRRLASWKGASDVYVVVPDDVYSEGAKLVMTTINHGCSGLRVFISRDGSVDRKKTYAENPCMGNVPGVDRWLKGGEN